MRKLSGLPVDSDHLDQLRRCVGLVRQSGQVPAIFLGDTSVRGVRAVADALAATAADFRTTAADVTLSPGPYAWSDQTPHVRRWETVQVLTNLDLLRTAFGDVFGPWSSVSMDRPSVPADAVWLAVVRPGRLRVCAAQWLPGCRPVVYYGCSFRLADDQPLAREAQNAA